VSGHVQEKEAVEDGSLTSIQDWPKASRGVRFEVGDCHFSAGKKSGGPGGKSKRNQRPAKEFNQASHQTFRIVDLGLAAEHTKQLLRAVACK